MSKYVVQKLFRLLRMGYLTPRHPHSEHVTLVTLNFSSGWRKEEAKGWQNVRGMGDGQSCGSWSRCQMTFCPAIPTWCGREDQQTALLLSTDTWLAACSCGDSSDPWQAEAVKRTWNKPHNILSRKNKYSYQKREGSHVRVTGCGRFHKWLRVLAEQRWLMWL